MEYKVGHKVRLKINAKELWSNRIVIITHIEDINFKFRGSQHYHPTSIISNLEYWYVKPTPENKDILVKWGGGDFTGDYADSVLLYSRYWHPFRNLDTHKFKEISYQEFLTHILNKPMKTEDNSVSCKAVNTLPEAGNYEGNDALEVYLKYFKHNEYTNNSQVPLERNIHNLHRFRWSKDKNNKSHASSTIDFNVIPYTLTEIEQFFNHSNLNNTNEISNSITKSDTKSKRSRASELSDRGHRRLYPGQLESQSEKAQEFRERKRRTPSSVQSPNRARELS